MLGRQRDRAVLDRLLDTARSGHSAVLVVHGDPGVGKTALLEYAIEAAEDFHVVRTSGVEGEFDLDYAALHQLCTPILEFIDRLPDPQRNALGVAFGLVTGPAPSPLPVGLAVLGLLSEAADQQPLLCVIDDAQWLDDASGAALAFVARRLLAERIALVFATRQVGRGLAGFPQFRVDPLGRRDSRALLESVLVLRLDESVLERIVTETGGNPLALLELPRGLTPPSSRAASACQRRCLCPPASSRVSGGGWIGSPTTRGSCCSWRRPSRSAIQRCCGGPRSSLGSRREPCRPWSQKAC